MLGQRVGLAHASVVLIGGAMLMACGGKAPPQTQMTAAQSAVRAAEVGGAEELPKGKLHVKYARDQIQQATALIEEKEYEDAKRVLERAEVDARYALALAQHEEARAEAEELLESIDELMEEGQ